MYARVVLTAVLLLGVVTSPVSIAVERPTGRIAVWRDGAVSILGADLIQPLAVLPAPPGEVELLDFAGGVVTYCFTLPEDGSPARAAVGVGDGIERLIWPNSGIGERFPSLGARLTADGQGIFEFVALDAHLRSELGLGEDIPDGAGTVVTYRFADEQVWAIAAADFVGAIALGPADALVVTVDGGVLRYRSPAGVVWRLPGEERKSRTILDADLVGGVVLLAGGHGLETVTLDSGERRGAWAEVEVADARLLLDGRLLACTRGGDLLVVTLAPGTGTAEPLSRLAGEGWPVGATRCSGGSRPLACLHPVPGGVVAPSAAGWRSVPLAGPASGVGSGPPGRAVNVVW